MVTACKNYLTDRGVNRVWDQPRQPLIEKLKACLKLNQEYQKCFQRTKKRIAEDPSKKPFEFSEMYIFGKFDTFCKRLNQVQIFILELSCHAILCLPPYPLQKKKNMLGFQRFSTECRETKTTVISLANPNKGKQHNQSELEANTCNRRQARENACLLATIG